MANSSNGEDDHRDPVRRFRIDDLPAIVLRNSPGPGSTSAAEGLEVGHSGRRFVLVAGICVLLIWGTLYLVFREWRAKYRERASYGVTHVIPALEPMRSIMPPHVDLLAWRDAVDQTRAMLVTVTASNLLDVNEMDKLRFELSAHARRASADPATAMGELAEIWNEVADRGEFLLKDSRSQSGERHPRPRILPPPPPKPH